MAKTPMEQVGVDLPDPVEAEPTAAQPQDAAPPEAPTRPEWLPQNFESPEALVRSYNEMGGKLREIGEDRRQLEERLAAVEQQQTSDDGTPQTQDFAAWQSQLEAMYETDPLQAQAYLAQQYADAAVSKALEQFQASHFATQQPMQNTQFELIAAQADNAMGGRYADWEQMKPLVAETLASDPDLMTSAEAQTLGGAMKSWDRAYKIAKLAQIEQAYIDGVPVQAVDTNGARPAPAQQPSPQPMLPQEELARVMKMQAQTQTGGNGRPDIANPSDDWLARMKNARQGQSWSAVRGPGN